VIYVAADFTNGGIAGIYRALQMAAAELGWNVSKVDGRGDVALVRKAFAEAVRSHPDAIVVGGFQPAEVSDLVTLAKQAHIVLIGWHAAEAPGPTKDLFVNVSTDPMAVADEAAKYAITIGHEKPGVVVFTDSRFAVARAKTERMKEVIGRCRTCRVLSVEDEPIGSAAKEVPPAVVRLNDAFGHEWTHTLAINDVYFDNMNFPLKNVGRGDVVNVSAGDGSHKALSRIGSGLSQQAATVAEPLNTQGWQLADELNRAFAGERPSGFVTKPLLITTETLQQTGLSGIESGIGYKEAYREIWHRQPVNGH
jgi:ribose transport system substrate-binding protein